MRYTVTIAALLLIAAVNGPLDAGRDRAAEADSLIQAAADTSLDKGERIRLLKRATGRDRTGKAMHTLSRLYMSLNSPADRHTAKLWLRKAIAREGENADYQATFAELLWRSLLRQASYEKARYALQLDPENVLGLFWAGKFIVWSWEMTFFTYEEERDRVDQPEGRDVVAGRTYRHFEYEDLDVEIGVEFLERALRVDPDHWPSRLELGMVFYTARRPDALIKLFEEDAGRHPDRYESPFFAGLGYQLKGDLQAAYKAYQSGLDRMTDRERRFIQSIFLMHDRKSDREGEPPPDEDAIRKFWFGRDPLFLTKENERLLEQCRRVAYANLRFTDTINGYKGWETDRGQAYIRYGDPIVRAMVPPGADLGLDRSIREEQEAIRRGDTKFRPGWRNEVWSYDGFELSFVITNSWDSWRAGPALIGIQSVSFGELVEKIPDYYRYPLAFDPPYQIAQFRDANGMTKLELYYGLSGDQVVRRQARPGVDSVDVVQALFLFDTAWDTVHHTTGKVRLMPVIEYPSIEISYLLASEQVILQPGSYYLSAEAQDQTSRKVGSLRDTVEVRRFGRDRLEVSSLLMARRIVEREDGPPGRGRFLVLPNPLGQAPRSGNTSFYFEVYNLNQDPYGATHYRVTYQTRVVPESDGPEELVEWATAISSEFRGTEEWEPFRLTLELDSQSTGRREFRVVVDDLQDLERAEETALFRVMW